MAVGMHKMRLGRSLASLIGEGEGSEDVLKAGQPETEFLDFGFRLHRRRASGLPL